MNKQFIQVTNGLLPVTVLALLVIAFVAGQARANIPGKATAAASFATNGNLTLSSDMLRKAESLPQVLETLMSLPTEFELNIRLLRKGTREQPQDDARNHNKQR
ncbi:MAG: hypothetical protein DHS20C05_24480 [Hyphococcus sp.]|nr:MAG: hypothetical protein DHS20C05_24480 [Marinicaulis sp.]